MIANGAGVADAGPGGNDGGGATGSDSELVGFSADGNGDGLRALHPVTAEARLITAANLIKRGSIAR